MDNDKPENCVVETEINEFIDPDSRDTIVIETKTITTTTTTTKRIHVKDPKIDLTEIQTLLFDDKPNTNAKLPPIANTTTNDLTNAPTTSHQVRKDSSKLWCPTSSPLSSTKLNDEIDIKFSDDEQLKRLTPTKNYENNQTIESENLSRISLNENKFNLKKENSTNRKRKQRRSTSKNKMPKTPKKYKDKRISDLIKTYSIQDSNSDALSSKKTKKPPRNESVTSNVNNDLSAILEASTESNAISEELNHSNLQQNVFDEIAEGDEGVEGVEGVEADETPTKPRSKQRQISSKLSFLTKKSNENSNNGNKHAQQSKSTGKRSTKATASNELATKRSTRAKKLADEPVKVTEADSTAADNSNAAVKSKKSNKKSTQEPIESTQMDENIDVPMSKSKKQKRALEMVEEEKEEESVNLLESDKSNTSKRRRVNAKAKQSNVPEKENKNSTTSNKRKQSSKETDKTVAPNKIESTQTDNNLDVKHLPKSKRNRQTVDEPLEAEDENEPIETLESDKPTTSKRPRVNAKIVKQSNVPEKESKTTTKASNKRKQSPKDQHLTDAPDTFSAPLDDVTNEMPQFDDELPNPLAKINHLSSIKIYSPSSRDRFKMDKKSNRIIIPKEMIKSKLKNLSNAPKDLMKRFETVDDVMLKPTSRLLYVPATKQTDNASAGDDIFAHLQNRRKPYLVNLVNFGSESNEQK